MIIDGKEYIEIHLEWLDDLVGVNIDKIKHYSLHETEIFIYFSQLDMENPSGWDVQLHFETEEEAKVAYTTLCDLSRRRKLRVISVNNNVK